MKVIKRIVVPADNKRTTSENEKDNDDKIKIKFSYDPNVPI